MLPARLCWTVRSSASARGVEAVQHELVIDRPCYLGSDASAAIHIRGRRIEPLHLVIDPRPDGVWLRAARNPPTLDDERIDGERELLELHGDLWTERVCTEAKLTAARLSRGFIHHVAAPREVLARLDLVFALAPLLRSLELDLGVWSGGAPFASPQLARLHALSVLGSGLVDEELTELAECPHLANLETLAMGMSPHPDSLFPELGVAGARALAASPHLAGLTSLRLGGPWRLEPGALEAFRTPARWRLKRLFLSFSVSPEDLAALAAAHPGIVITHSDGTTRTTP